jgi:hypothetical protein
MKILLAILALSPLATQLAIAQHVPADNKILHDAAVAPRDGTGSRTTDRSSVSHGVVTLIGTVSSEGDKVLAAIEFGRVDGVRTVLNNLQVRSSGAQATSQLPTLANPEGAQVQALTGEQSLQQQNNAILANTVTVPEGSLLQIRLADPISTKTAIAGDQFHCTLAAAVSNGRMIAIPAGTSVLGRVVSAKGPGRFVSAAKLSLELISSAEIVVVP